MAHNHLKCPHYADAEKDGGGNPLCKRCAWVNIRDHLIDSGVLGKGGILLAGWKYPSPEEEIL